MIKTHCLKCKQPVLLLDTIKHKPITLNPKPSREGTIIINHNTALVHRSINSIHPNRLHEPRYTQHECP